MAEYDRKDRFYTRAKEEGYRSRAAYKLLELQEKYKFLRPNKRVLDLGCFPGGWCQVASNAQANVVGVDLRPLAHFGVPTIKILQGDASLPEVQEKLEELGGGKFDVVLSDMSPHLTGIVSRDNVAIAELVDLAFQIAQRMLKPGGIFVAKAFPSSDIEEILKRYKSSFGKITRAHLQSTRSTSNEFYIIATLPK